MADCDVFISYKREERPRVEALAAKLKSIGLKVWLDTRLAAGASFDDEIAGNLKAAKAVLVCWTPGAIASDWVRAEAAMAHSANKLVAAFLEPTELIPPFNLIHAEDLSAWSGEDDHAGWAKILARVASLSAEPGLVEWANVIGAGDAGALRKWIAAQPAGPVRSTSRFWLSEMNAAPIQGVARTGVKARAGGRKGGAGLGIVLSLVLIALVAGGGYYVWRMQPGQATETNTPATIVLQNGAEMPAASSGGSVQSGIAPAAPPPAAIQIGPDTVVHLPPNSLIDFETGNISQSDLPGADFELVFQGYYRWRARGDTARMQWDGMVSTPNARVCGEVRPDYFAELSAAREPASAPYQCFITSDGHRGYIRGIRAPYDPEAGVDFAITFFNQ